MYVYKTSGVCSKKIEFRIEENRVKDVVFTDGCNGNLSGISNLVDGMLVEEVISKLENIKCGRKATSCPAQLAIALKKEYNNI